MNEIDKLIARMGFQLVQYELTMMDLQRKIADYECQLEAAIKRDAPQPPPPLANPSE